MTQQALSTISVQFKPVLPELVALNITQKKTIIVKEKAAYKGGNLPGREPPNCDSKNWSNFGKYKLNMWGRPSKFIIPISEK